MLFTIPGVSQIIEIKVVIAQRHENRRRSSKAIKTKFKISIEKFLLDIYKKVLKCYIFEYFH